MDERCVMDLFKHLRIGESGDPIGVDVKDANIKANRMNCCVKICGLVTPVPTSPICTPTPYNIDGSGFAIRHRTAPDQKEGELFIVTNAHVIKNASSILARLNGQETKLPCCIRLLSHAHDLALLSLCETDEELASERTRFISECHPAQLKPEMPNPGDAVLVLGFPLKSNNVSASAGIASCSLFMDQGNGKDRGQLAFQMDAAVNPGNSGGPVFDLASGCVVGVVRSRNQTAQNINYAIPVIVLQHLLIDLLPLLKGASHNPNTQPASNIHAVVNNGGSRVPLFAQAYGNPNVFERLALPASLAHRGLLVLQTQSLDEENSKTPKHMLQEEDVALEINGVPIGRDGKVNLHRGTDRVYISAVWSLMPPGTPIAIKVWRDKQIQHVSGRTSCIPTDLIPSLHTVDTPVCYLVWENYVFATATWQMINGFLNYFDNLTICKLNQETIFDVLDEGHAKTNTVDIDGDIGRRECVMLQYIGDGEHGENHGFQFLVVHMYDGVRVHNLMHLARLFTRSICLARHAKASDPTQFSLLKMLRKDGLLHGRHVVFKHDVVEHKKKHTAALLNFKLTADKSASSLILSTISFEQELFSLVCSLISEAPVALLILQFVSM